MFSSKKLPKSRYFFHFSPLLPAPLSFHFDIRYSIFLPSSVLCLRFLLPPLSFHFDIRYSLFDIRYSLFDIRYSFRLPSSAFAFFSPPLSFHFDIRYSLFDIRYSFPRPSSIVPLLSSVFCLLRKESIGLTSAVFDI